MRSGPPGHVGPIRDSALVLFSGGQDSTICLAWALEHFPQVETIGFHYGQRHVVEMDCRREILISLPELKNWKGRLGPDHIVQLGGALGDIGNTALTSDSEIRVEAQGLPNTFVPGRNLIFLTFAAAIAWRRNFGCLVGGMCETDFSGYPDCRDDTIKAMQVALNLGLLGRFVIETPLMWCDKAESWALASRLGGPSLVALVEESTHTCYLGDRSQRHPWGYGCGTCPACELRAAGWQRWKAANQVASC